MRLAYESSLQSFRFNLSSLRYAAGLIARIPRTRSRIDVPLECLLAAKRSVTGVTFHSGSPGALQAIQD
jgi:hypothetical protein